MKRSILPPDNAPEDGATQANLQRRRRNLAAYLAAQEQAGTPLPLAMSSGGTGSTPPPDDGSPQTSGFDSGFGQNFDGRHAPATSISDGVQIGTPASRDETTAGNGYVEPGYVEPNYVQETKQHSAPTSTSLIDVTNEGVASTAEVLRPAGETPGTADSTRVLVNGLVREFVVSGTAANDYSALLARLDAIETGFRKIAPVVEALHNSRGRIGHNQPPEPIDPPPVFLGDLETGVVATTLIRTELASKTPRKDVLNLCEAVLQNLWSRIKAFARWIKSKGQIVFDEILKELAKRGTQAGITYLALQELLNGLDINLAQLISKLAKLLH